MATARRTVAPEFVLREVEKVALTMDADEATAILDVLMHVGGPPATTRRGLTDNVSQALRQAGVKPKFEYYSVSPQDRDVAGKVEFT